MSPQVQSDIEKLISYSIEFAETMLLDGGEFYPFGSKINSSGEFIPVSFFDDEEYPESQKLIDGLTAAFEKAFNKKEVKAYCIAYDVRVKNDNYSSPQDAILVFIKHEEVKENLTYYYPYELGSENKLKFLEPWREHDN